MWKFYHVLSEPAFAKSETELDYYHQRVNVQVTSQVAESFKTEDIRKLVNFKKIPKKLEIKAKYPADHPN